MANKQGDFIWYELMTPDAKASAAFYAPMLGWSVRDDPLYGEITASEGMVGGMLTLDAAMTAGGARPGWLGYILVDDVDEMVGSVGQGGGKTYVPPRDIPGIGRFALLADPQGAPFYVMKPIPPANKPDMTSNAFAAERPMLGHCAWNELVTNDPAAAWSFYGARFGWAKDGEMDMGPMGKYEFIRHGHMIGAVMPKPPHIPVSTWNYYFRVADIDAAAAHVGAHGGTVVHGPQQIPGGDFILHASDPQGAQFALIGKREAA